MTTEATATLQLGLKKRLIELMKMRGLTAAALSRKSGVPKQVLSDWLAGAEPRKLVHLKRVSAALGTSMDDLCFPSQDESTHNEWVEGAFEAVFLGKIRRSSYQA